MKKKAKKSKKLKPPWNNNRITARREIYTPTSEECTDFANQVERAMMDLANASNKPKIDKVHTHCANCNLKLIIPKVESHRCILCGCKELRTRPWSPM